jgi:hypothetical protein
MSKGGIHANALVGEMPATSMEKEKPDSRRLDSGQRKPQIGK